MSTLLSTRRLARRLLGPVLIAVTAACGGGGGGASAPLVYQGNLSPARIEATNAGEVAAAFAGSDATARFVTASASGESRRTPPTGAGTLVRLLTPWSAHLAQAGELVGTNPEPQPARPQRATPLDITVDDRIDCDRGHLQFQGTLTDDGLGTLEVTFEACEFDGVTMRGSGSIVIDEVIADEPTDFTINLDRVRLTGAGLNLEIAGGVRNQVTFGATFVDRLTFNLVGRDTASGRMTRIDEFVVETTIAAGAQTPSQTQSGRLFDSLHGYVDVVTVVPFTFTDLDQSLPGPGGQVRLVGADDASIRLTALVAAMVQIDLDLDGDAQYEATARSKWAALGSGLTADLRDSDADGLHDSWEDAYGLDPDAPVDSRSDSDGDGLTDRIEYRIGGDPLDGVAIAYPSWQAITSREGPQARAQHGAVWTGREMLVWGGDDGNAIAKSTGGRYDPLTDRWLPTATQGAPRARTLFSAIWTGAEMIVWGGFSGAFDFQTLGDGARYDPRTDSWSPLSNTGAPSPRAGHTVVWTGSAMIVWGGFSCLGCANAELDDGAVYDPTRDAWSPLPSAGAPAPRGNHSAVWTGARMIVWGGENDTSVLASGASYDLAGDRWEPISVTGAPAARRCHFAAWSGEEMLVFGGQTDRSLGCQISSVSSGGRYDAGADQWRDMRDAPLAFTLSSAVSVWTGTHLVTWAGEGARYDPVADAWARTAATGAPSTRREHSMVWNGWEVMVWGGSFAGPLGDGGTYNPGSDLTP